MTCFLTSRPFDDAAGTICEANGLAERVKRALPETCRAVTICSDPDTHDRTEFFAALGRRSFENLGIRFSSFCTLDGKNRGEAAELVKNADLVVLAGGHVPTQNRFFREIGLRELLEGFTGTVFGISAGSMNSADVVYATPELGGEASDPKFRRFLPGLNLTKIMLVPHYQTVKNDVLDGLRVIEDIVCTDSMGRTFYAIPDGSYLLAENGTETLYGEAYRIRSGVITKLCSAGESICLSGAAE